MNNFERLAIAQAMMKQISAAVKTGEPDNLRGLVDGEMYEMAETANVSSVNIPINGQEVGIKMGITPSKEETAEERVIADPQEFEAWCVDNAREVIHRLMVCTPDVLLQAALSNSNGEVPEGTNLEKRVVKKAPQTRLTGVKAEKIAQAYGTPQALNEAIAQTLGLPRGDR